MEQIAVGKSDFLIHKEDGKCLTIIEKAQKLLFCVIILMVVVNNTN